MCCTQRPSRPFLFVDFQYSQEQPQHLGEIDQENTSFLEVQLERRLMQAQIFLVVGEAGRYDAM